MTITSKPAGEGGFTRGHIILAVSSLLLVVAFFLPWLSTGSSSASGLSIASQANALQPLGVDSLGIAALLYLIPALAVLALLLAFVRQYISGPASAAAGVLAFAMLVVFLVQVTQAPVLAKAVEQGGTPLPFFGLGLWASIVAVFGIAVGGMMIAQRYLAPSVELTTRRIVTAGMLGAVAITLGVTRLGFIPVPNITANATILHLPAIIGAILEGPIVGVLAGGIFGVFSWVQSTTPLFADPRIAVIPRLLIGLVAWLAYRALKPINTDLAAAGAGVAGTLTNTVGVLTLGVLYGQLPISLIPTIIPQALAEVVIAAVLSVLVVRGVSITRSGRTIAEDTEPREKSYY
jgi:uncharacterized membrane protein